MIAMAEAFRQNVVGMERRWRMNHRCKGGQLRSLLGEVLERRWVLNIWREQLSNIEWYRRMFDRWVGGGLTYICDTSPSSYAL